MPKDEAAHRQTVSVVDQTIRDGPQSLYTERMNTMPKEMVFALAPELGRLPFKTVDLGGMVKLDRLVRAGEDPWEHIRRVKELAPNARFRWSTFPNAITFGLESEELCDFAIQVCIRNGIQEFWLLDTLFNIDVEIRRIKAIKEAGGDVVASLMYTLSPIHTDDYYRDKAEKLAAAEGLDGFYVEDTAGALLPDRAATLIDAIHAGARGLPIEVHFHDFNGFSTLSYLNAISSGATTVHTAIGPLAGGGSLPSLRTFLDSLARESDLVCDIAVEDLDRVEDLAWSWTRRYGLPSGGPSEYNHFLYQHQLPGGMQSSLQRQLDQLDLGEKLGDVLEEMARVRVELGYPVMATPLSQFVGVQAVLNVASGKRYEFPTDDLCHYVLGHYGDVPGPIDLNVMDKISESRAYRSLVDWEFPQTTLTELRQRLGTELSDEELLLRYVSSETDIATMRMAVETERLSSEMGRSLRASFSAMCDLIAGGGLIGAELSGECGNVRVRRA